MSAKALEIVRLALPARDHKLRPHTASVTLPAKKLPRALLRLPWGDRESLFVP